MQYAKGVIFDYGGTLDTNGVHWFHIFRQVYARYLPNIAEGQLRDAYVYAERCLAMHRIIEPGDDFLAMLRKKVAIQMEQLSMTSSVNVENIAVDCDAMVRANMQQTHRVLDVLSKRYPIVLVSNFYGNIHAVLRSYGLDGYFNKVIESAIVGARKPDPRIFALGVEALGLQPKEIVVVGDSYGKDIVPAHSLGCRTVWLKGLGWNTSEEPSNAACADMVIGNLDEVVPLLS